tara:strand:- start:13777 stop:15699 length:1923 start_codon:yes stop_codon:yes gene_type:complete
MKEFLEAQVIFVSDFFIDEYSGGAEKTTDALSKSSPLKTINIKSNQITEELIQNGAGKYWVFFNFSQLNGNLIPLIVGSLQYSVVEYDYKMCKYRSLDLHKQTEGVDCDCANQQQGKIVSAFFHGSDHIFWMSKKQSEIYHENFPFLKEHKQTVLSSVFDVDDLSYIESLRNKRENVDSTSWAVVTGGSWIKGVNESIDAVKNASPENTAEVLSDLTYYNLLGKLSEFNGLSFHPLGADTCPRTTIEAKLLGLELLINDNVQHKDEEWFNIDIDGIESYLLSRHEVFWGTIISIVEKPVTISGYTTTKDLESSNYPWHETIKSMLGFCDEVVVLDGGSKDNTWVDLQAWASKEPKLKVRQIVRDWDNYRFAIFDSAQKAAARSLCTSDWCIQMDCDEIIHEDDYGKIRTMVKQAPKGLKILCLPVIDYWGDDGKVRVDVHPWKWRLSRNDTHITHDIPASHRAYDEHGNLYSKGSDGCDYVHTDSYQPIPHANFYTKDHDELRQRLLSDPEFREIHLKDYEKFMNSVVTELPSVHHYSWWDIERKMFSYKTFWSKFWASLYNKTIEDVPENNMFFDKAWSEVSDEEIKAMAKKMNDDLGGWVMHSKVDFSKPTPWFKLDCGHPKVMEEWLSRYDSKKESK